MSSEEEEGSGFHFGGETCSWLQILAEPLKSVNFRQIKASCLHVPLKEKEVLSKTNEVPPQTLTAFVFQRVWIQAGGGHQGGAGEGTRQRRRGSRRSRWDGPGAEGEDLPAAPHPETERRHDRDKSCQGNDGLLWSQRPYS